MTKSFPALLSLPLDPGFTHIWKKEQLISSLEELLDQLRQEEVGISLVDGDAEFSMYNGFDKSEIVKKFSKQITIINLVKND